MELIAHIPAQSVRSAKEEGLENHEVRGFFGPFWVDAVSGERTADDCFEVERSFYYR